MIKQHLQTKILKSGISPSINNGAIPPPIQRGSTILMQHAEQLYGQKNRTYGIEGLCTHDALQGALCELEGAKHCQLAPSGLLACTLPILAMAEAGSHILVTDGVYGPTRRFCDRSLARLGVETEYFSPSIGSEIEQLIRPSTKLIFMENPSSLTFEIADTPAIVEIARAKGVATAIDNTWSSGLFYSPLKQGVDISIQATTKYLNGHSDVLSGAVLTSNDRIAGQIKATASDLGLHIAADDAWLILRGMKTLYVRLAQHQVSAMEIATWLEQQPEIARILYPALPGDRFHHLWKRDFTGAAGMFGAVLQPCSPTIVMAFINALSLFGIGFSWGGYDSLAIHCDPQLAERKKPPKLEGPLIRLHIGLENVADLKADLANALAQIRAAKSMDKSA